MHQDKSRNGRVAYAFWSLAGLAIVYGIIHATSLAYVNDDAFISFRYAKNLVNGLGLIYNAGERVEGYTNFLWTLLISAGLKCHIDPVNFSTIAGIVFYTLTLGLYVLLSWKFRGSGKRLFFIAPVTAIALSLHRDFAVYGTSGLETSMYTFFISCAFALLLTGSSRRSSFAVGAIFVLALMTRPDGMIFFIVSLVYIAVTRNEWVKHSFALLLPVITLWLPYWIWRYQYYGYFFPNAFYAKSVGLSYYSQGFRYLELYFKTYYVFGILIVLGIASVVRQRHTLLQKDVLRSSLQTRRENADAPHPVLLGALYCLACTIFLFRIGGDFMFARFLVPVTPFLYFMSEWLIQKVPALLPRLVLILIVVIGTIFRLDQFRNSVAVDNIADEVQVYTASHLNEARRKGEMLRKYCEGLSVRVAFFGGQARMVYYMEPALAIESETGLTDAYIAHLPIVGRSMMGHEKKAPMSYIRSRNVHFLFGTFPETLDRIKFQDVTARIVVYDNTIMSRLEQTGGVTFVAFPGFLDAYIAQMGSLPLKQIKEDYDSFKRYYFDCNADSSRQEVFISLFRSLEDTQESFK